MDENTTQREKRKRKRREVLIIILFQFASIFLCSLSIILRVGVSSAEEFVPVPLHALNVGDYSADDPLYQFQKANFDLVMEVLFDRESQVADIAHRATAVAREMLTPVPTVTPHIRDESSVNKITPSAAGARPPSKTQLPTKLVTATPPRLPDIQPTQTATSLPEDSPKTWPTTRAPILPSATPKPTKLPGNPVSVTATLSPTATDTQTSTPTATPTPTAIATATSTPTSTPTASGMPINAPTATPTQTTAETPIVAPTTTGTPIATETQTSTATATATSTSTPLPIATNTPSSTATETPTNTPLETPTNTLTPTETQASNTTPTPTATGTLTNIPTATPTPTATSTPTPTNTPTTTATETPTNTPMATDTPTSTPPPTSTATATLTNTPTLTAASTSTPTPTTTGTPTNTPTASPTFTATPTPTSTPVMPDCYLGIPPGFRPSDDAFIRATSPDSNFGSLPEIEVRPDSDANRRGLVRFDLSSIPPGSTVTSATLYLYEIDKKQDQVTYIYKVTSPWSEGFVTWNSPWMTPGGDFDNSYAYASFLPIQSSCMLAIDLTELVQEWVDGGPNYGFILYSTGLNHILRYSSKENSASDEHPKLHITYLEPALLLNDPTNYSSSAELMLGTGFRHLRRSFFR
jgi:hypothetical protein